MKGINIEEVVYKLISEDEELKAKLKQKIMEAIDSLEIELDEDILSKGLSQAIENYTDDWNDAFGVFVTEKLKSIFDKIEFKIENKNKKQVRKMQQQELINNKGWL